MDPLTTALIAGASGALTETVQSVVKDGYSALKGALIRRFGKKPEVVQALESVEKKPESKARQAVLEEELQEVGATKDSELLKLASGFLDLLQKEGALSQHQYQAYLQGDGAIALGDRSVSAGKGGLAAGRDVEISFTDRGLTHGPDED